MGNRLLTSALAAAWLGLAPTPAVALPGVALGQAGAKPAPGSPGAKRIAKRHFDKAKKAYKNGSYQEAVAELNQAIEHDPDGKDLLFNLGLVHEKLGELEPAIAAFKRFSELETKPDELERVIQTIRRLEGARDELARKKAAEDAERARREKREEPKTPPPRAEPKAERPPPPRKGRLDGWVYGTAGLALLSAGVGTYFALKAVSTRNEADAATGPGTSVSELQDRADRAHGYAITADVLYGVAIASAGGAVLLYVLRDEKPAGGPSVGAGLGPRNLFLQGTF